MEPKDKVYVTFKVVWSAPYTMEIKNSLEPIESMVCSSEMLKSQREADMRQGVFSIRSMVLGVKEVWPDER